MNRLPSMLYNFDEFYEQACQFAERNDFSAARHGFEALLTRSIANELRALTENNLATLDALEGKESDGLIRLARALELDATCIAAQQNLAVLNSKLPCRSSKSTNLVAPEKNDSPASIRVAIVSLLFNWPSTGGGTVHTLETGKFLSRAGYDVKHFYARYGGWNVGNVTDTLPYKYERLDFSESTWNSLEIQRRFREAVGQFEPDYVIITDSWNFKPLLAQALQGFRYFLRLAAQECLCPLNNVRMLPDDKGNTSSCPRHQLATTDICRRCVVEKASWSGSLHQAERDLAGFGSSQYDQILRDSFAQAEGILVVNPMIAAMVSPYAKAVHVVPSGFDPERFPNPNYNNTDDRQTDKPTRLLFAGLTDEYMKGFHILRDACQQLWMRRHDFELIITGDPISDVEPFVRYIGWKSQEELPERMREADILIFPTIAEEALGRSAVEAMGCGLPVVASRIGGLPYTIVDGLTGLLCNAGNATDLAKTIEQLLDDPMLRERMGKAGRKRFEENYTWDIIIDRHYSSLLTGKGECANSCVTDSAKFDVRSRSDRDQLPAEVSSFLGIPRPEIQRMFETYRTFHDSEEHFQIIGETKCLTVEECFLIGIVLSLARPANLIQVSSDDSPSTQRLVDLCQFVGLNSKIICYDKANSLRFASKDEVEFEDVELIGRFRTEVLDKYGSGCLIVNVDSMPLLSEILYETALHYGTWAIAIQECDQRILDTALNTLGMDQFQSKIFATKCSLGLLVPSHLRCNLAGQQGQWAKSASV